MSKYLYPRAGQGGDARLAGKVAGLLEGAVAAGVPFWKLGPSLVMGFASFFRRIPSRIYDKSQVPLLYTILGSGTPPLKMSKEDSAFQARGVGRQACGNCSSSYRQVAADGDMICSQIEGKIDSGSWCRLWNTDRH